MLAQNLRKTKSSLTVKTYISDLRDYLEEKNAIDISETNAINSLIYGVNCYSVTKGNIKKGILYLNDSKRNILSFATKSNDSINNIKLELIERITFNPNSKNLMNCKKQKENRVMQLFLHKITYDFLFEYQEDLIKILKGIFLYSMKSIGVEDNIEAYIDELWRKYDKDFNNYLDKEEFEQLAEELGLNPRNDLIYEIDTNKDGKIQYNEILDYYRSLTTGGEFTNIFNEYSEEINDERFISIYGIIKFFKEVQKEPINLFEAANMIIKFKRNITKNEKNELFKLLDYKYAENDLNLYKKNIYEIEKEFNETLLSVRDKFYFQMNLKEFGIMLNSEYNSIYTNLQEDLDLDHPLTDYFINSTHNTYLTGHQLHGKSTAKMYSHAVLNNYRLVELDCYDGDGNNIIVTHGYTFVEKINAKDILNELKENSFISSDLPVILCIENHLDKKHQNVLVDLLKDILGDLYIFPQDNIPEYLPNLSELKKKFLVKCGGPRISEDLIKNPIKRKKKKRKQSTDSNFKRNNNLLRKSTVYFKTSFLKAMKKKTSMLILNENKNKPLLKHMLEQNNTLKIKELDEENENEDIVETLDKIRGIYGTKFYFEKIEKMNYQPWEMVTLKCNKCDSYSSTLEKRIKMINFSKNSLIKVYPQNFDSSNYNIIKWWLLGANVCALNIQAIEDDYTLYDKIFFLQNNNVGYVLKPYKLLYGYDEIEDYQKPYFKVSLYIISIFALSKLIEEKEEKINQKKPFTLEVYILGSREDEENNIKYTFKLKDGFIFTKIEDNKEMIFNVYEKDLSGLMIKIKYNGNILARSCIPFCMAKEGYRRIPIYDILCKEFNASCIVGLFKKIEIDDDSEIDNVEREED